jgi:hypothetical protein
MCEECRNLLRDGHGPTYSSLLEQLREMDTDVAVGDDDDDPEGTNIWKLVSKASIETRSPSIGRVLWNNSRECSKNILDSGNVLLKTTT